MQLILDIGNSNIVSAIYQDGNCIYTNRIKTDKFQPAFYYQNYFSRILLELSLRPERISDICISSVVIEITDTIVEAVVFYFGKSPFVINPEVIIGLDMPVPRPYEIGSDLVANAYTIYKKEMRDSIVVDFGTALTFTVVSAEKGVLGVTIAPGLKTSIKALSASTSRLPEVPLKMPESSIGKNTVHAIQAGVLFGYIGLVKEITNRIRNETGAHYRLVATGGLSAILEPLESYFDEIDPHLTLSGIQLMHQYTRNNT